MGQEIDRSGGGCRPYPAPFCDTRTFYKNGLTILNYILVKLNYVCHETNLLAQLGIGIVGRVRTGQCPCTSSRKFEYHVAILVCTKRQNCSRNGSDYSLYSY